MKAIKTIDTNEWCHIMEDGTVATCSLPELFPDSSSLERMREYWEDLSRVFNPTNVSIKMVEVDVTEKELQKFDSEYQRLKSEIKKKVQDLKDMYSEFSIMTSVAHWRTTGHHLTDLETIYRELDDIEEMSEEQKKDPLIQNILNEV
jgi:uncharacterized protein (DUF1919 family)